MDNPENTDHLYMHLYNVGPVQHCVKWEISKTRRSSWIGIASPAYWAGGAVYLKESVSIILLYERVVCRKLHLSVIPVFLISEMHVWKFKNACNSSLWTS